MISGTCDSGKRDTTGDPFSRRRKETGDRGMKVNLHTHTRFCDGTAEPAAMLLAAGEAGYQGLGFSSHAPVPFSSNWNMKWERLDEYLQEIRELRDRAVQPEVFLGLEADYIPGVIRPAEWRAVVKDIDYLIGSVHYLGVLADGTPWTVDFTEEHFQQGVEESFGGDPVAAAVEYFRRVGEMAEMDRPDVIGHCDLVKLFLTGNQPQVLNDPRWQHAERAMLDSVAISGCVLEMNVKGIIRGTLQEACPSDRILASAARRGIPVCIGADAHSPAELSFDWTVMEDRLRRAGYRERVILTRRGWLSVSLDESGQGSENSVPQKFQRSFFY